MHILCIEIYRYIRIITSIYLYIWCYIYSIYIPLVYQTHLQAAVQASSSGAEPAERALFAEPEKALAASLSHRLAETEQKTGIASPTQPQQDKSSAYQPLAKGSDDKPRELDKAPERQPGKQPAQQLPALVMEKQGSRGAEADRGEGEKEEESLEPEERPEEPERPLPQLTGRHMTY